MLAVALLWTGAAQAACGPAPMADPGDMMLRFPVAQGVWAGSASMLAGSVANTNVSVEGVVVYDAIAKTLKLCDGDDWQTVSLGTGSDPRIGTLTAGKWCSSDGSTIACTADAPVALAGSDKQVIFNDGGTTLAGAAQLFWDKSNNRLGIRTSSPVYALDVRSGFRLGGTAGGEFWSERSDSEFDFIAPPGSVKRLLSLHGSPSGTSEAILDIYGHNGTSYVFGLAVENNGHVRIGTGNATSRLNVGGGVQIGNDAADCPGVSNVKLGTLRYSGGAFSVCVAAGWTPLATGAGAVAAGSTGQIQFNGGSGTFAADTGLHWDNTNKRLGLGTVAPSRMFHMAGTEGVVRIDREGADGGTIYLNRTVSSMLQGGFLITGTESALRFAHDTDATGSSTELLRITSGGNVGIGTSTPAGTLHVYGNGPQFRIQDDNDASSFFEILDPYATQALIRKRTAAGDTLIDISPMADDGISKAYVRLFRETNTTGDRGLLILRGDGTSAIDHALLSGTTARSYLAASGGYVGIGTMTPSAKTEIYGTAQLTAALTDSGERGAILALNSNSWTAGNGGAITFGNSQSLAAGSIGFAAIKGLLSHGGGNTIGSIGFSTRNAITDTALTERMRIDYNGNVGIGTTSPQYELHIASSFDEEGAPGLFIQDPTAGSSSYGGRVYFDDRGGLNVVKLATVENGVESGFLAINRPNGNVGIGTAAPSHLLHVAGVARSTQASFATSSDGRVKENIHSIDEGLEVVLRLNPVTFAYTQEYQAGNAALAGMKRGFIAQEVEKVLPDLVTRVQETVGVETIEDFRVLNNSDFVPFLVSAVKELKAENDNLRAEFNAYRAAHP